MAILCCMACRRSAVRSRLAPPISASPAAQNLHHGIRRELVEPSGPAYVTLESGQGGLATASWPPQVARLTCGARSVRNTRRSIPPNKVPPSLPPTRYICDKTGPWRHVYSARHSHLDPP